MAWLTDEDECTACRPVLLDDNDEPVTEDTDVTRAIRRVWRKWPLSVREAYHRYHCEHSTDPADVNAAKQIDEGYNFVEVFEQPLLVDDLDAFIKR